MSSRVVYWTIWTAALLFFAAFYTLLIPFPLYLEQCGLKDWQVGAVLGAFGIASLVARPLAGYVADRWGPRPVVWAGTAMLVVGAAGVPLTDSAAVLFLLRVLQALGYSAFTTAATAQVANLVPPDRRGSALATFGVSVNLAMTLTPMIIGVCLDTLTVRGALWLSAGIALGAGLLCSWARPSGNRCATGLDWRTAYIPPASLRRAMAAALVFGVGYGTFIQFLPLLAERRGIMSAGTAYAVYGGAIMVTRLTTAKRQNGRDRRHLLWPAFLCLAAGLGSLALAKSATAALVGAAFIGVAGGVLHPGLIATAVELMPDDQRARAVANIYLGFDVGIGAGVWLLTPVFTRFGVEGVFLAASVISACGAGIVLRPWGEATPSQSDKTKTNGPDLC
jgi:MFS family permease